VRFLPPSPSLTPSQGPTGYVAPTPHYAISMSSKIPEGYVAHAKDSCVTVDYQWDSMRTPFEWGDGGVFGEEWASMHHRFRKGVQGMVDWYSTAESPSDVVTRTVQPSTNKDDEFAIDDSVEDEAESVVVIVSHGAGCNALIGAITHQPVLMDVGMASLTMAVRKPGKGFEEVPVAGDVDTSISSAYTKGIIPIHQYYDLKLFANNEHLRSVSSSPSVSRLPSSSNIYNSASRGRMPDLGAYPTTGGSLFTYTDSFNRIESRSNSANASLGSIRRPSHNTYSLPRTSTISTIGHSASSPSIANPALSRSPSVGLWSPVASRLTVSQENEDDDDDMFPDFDHKKKFAPVRKNTKDSLSFGTSPASEKGAAFPATTPGPALTTAAIPLPIQIPTGSEQSEDPDQMPAPSPQLGQGVGGLWGSPRPTVGPIEVPMRDLTLTKRRWTVNDRA
jgi:hypothetical protein